MHKLRAFPSRFVQSDANKVSYVGDFTPKIKVYICF